LRLSPDQVAQGKFDVLIPHVVCKAVNVGTQLDKRLDGICRCYVSRQREASLLPSYRWSLLGMNFSTLQSILRWLL
jgi:hypothetical protein